MIGLAFGASQIAQASEAGVKNILETRAENSNENLQNKYCTNEVLNPTPKPGQVVSCGPTICRALIRAGSDNRVNSWKLAMSSAERFVRNYPQCRSFISDCIACATLGKGTVTIKEYVTDESLWKNAGNPALGTIYWAPILLVRRGTDKTIETTNQSCRSQKYGICVTSSFAKSKLCSKTTNITDRLLQGMLNAHGAAFKHLVENNGAKESMARWNATSPLGPICEYGIRVEGAYRGSSVNKWYWTRSNIYIPSKQNVGDFVLDLMKF